MNRTEYQRLRRDARALAHENANIDMADSPGWARAQHARRVDEARRAVPAPRIDWQEYTCGQQFANRRRNVLSALQAIKRDPGNRQYRRDLRANLYRINPELLHGRYARWEKSMCLAGMVNTSNVVRLGDVKNEREAIKAAVQDYCVTKRLSPLQTQSCVEVALAIGGSSAAAIEHGRKMADRIAEKMSNIRTRFGTRGDDGPRAA